MFKKRGKWYITFRSVPDGKHIQRKSGANKRTASLHEARMRLEWQTYQATGVYRDPKMDLPIWNHVSPYLEQLAVRVSQRRYDTVSARLGRAHSIDRQMRAEVLARELRRTFAPATVDAYFQILKAFGNWMVDDGRATKNPYRALRRTFVRGRDETFVRRALSLDQVRRLAEAAPGRAVLYYVAATTGLRAGELRSLTWDNVRLVGESKVWAIVLSGEHTKNGKDAVIPVQPWVAEMLIPGLPGCHLFLCEDIAAELVRLDATKAGIDIIDREGRVLDFHSLRSSAATILLTLGVPSDAVQEIMRHGSFDTTLAHYRKSDIDVLAKQVVIPDPRRIG